MADILFFVLGMGAGFSSFLVFFVGLDTYQRWRRVKETRQWTVKKHTQKAK